MTRFGRPAGRFFGVKDEQRRIDRDMELYQTTYGTVVAWYFLDRSQTVVDDIYDEGFVEGGKAFDGPHPIPVLAAVPTQGQDAEDDRGFATYDSVTLQLSFEQARRARLSGDLVRDRERHLHDRFVFRERVFDVKDIQMSGHFDPTNRDTVIRIVAEQVRPDELVDSAAFSHWSA